MFHLGQDIKLSYLIAHDVVHHTHGYDILDSTEFMMPCFHNHRIDGAQHREQLALEGEKVLWFDHDGMKDTGKLREQNIHFIADFLPVELLHCRVILGTKAGHVTTFPVVEVLHPRCNGCDHFNQYCFIAIHWDQTC